MAGAAVSPDPLATPATPPITTTDSIILVFLALLAVLIAGIFLGKRETVVAALVLLAGVLLAMLYLLIFTGLL